MESGILIYGCLSFKSKTPLKIVEEAFLDAKSLGIDERLIVYKTYASFVRHTAGRVHLSYITEGRMLTFLTVVQSFYDTHGQLESLLGKYKKYLERSRPSSIDISQVDDIAYLNLDILNLGHVVKSGA
jgi:hypothetical protein